MRDIILTRGIPNPNSEGDYLKIQTVKSLKEILGLGLKEAKDLVDDMPSKIAERITAEKAEELTKAFEKEGMEIEIRNSLNNVVYYQTKDRTEEIAATVKLVDHSADIKTPHYWIMGTPDRGDDVYDLLQDKDPLLQLKINVSKEMLENPSRLLWINDSHEINAISVENNVSLINLITKNWIELKLPWTPKDKEFVWAWNCENPCMKSLVFYDAKNNCNFTGVGRRDGCCNMYYAPFEGELPEWAKEALKRLDD